MKKILSLILASSLLLVACGNDKKVEAPAQEQKIVKAVEVADVETREMSKLFQSTSIWEPLAKIDFSTDRGGTVEKITNQQVQILILLKTIIKNLKLYMTNN